MNDLLKQMAADLRTVSRSMDRMAIELGVMRRWMDRVAERDEFGRIVAGLEQRDVITRRDADKALGKINGEGKDN